MEDRGLTLKGEITMMKAMKNFMDKQWTWGTYFKLCGMVYGAYVALIGACAESFDHAQSQQGDSSLY